MPSKMIRRISIHNFHPRIRYFYTQYMHAINMKMIMINVIYLHLKYLSRLTDFIHVYSILPTSLFFIFGDQFLRISQSIKEA